MYIYINTANLHIFPPKLYANRPLKNRCISNCLMSFYKQIAVYSYMVSLFDMVLKLLFE